MDYDWKCSNTGVTGTQFKKQMYMKKKVWHNNKKQSVPVGAEVFRLVDVVAAVPFVIVREAVEVNGVIVVEFLSGGLDVVLLLVVLTAVTKIVLLSALVKTGK